MLYPDSTYKLAILTAMAEEILDELSTTEDLIVSVQGLILATDRRDIEPGSRITAKDYKKIVACCRYLHRGQYFELIRLTDAPISSSRSRSYRSQTQ
jgi:hypothetical protein